MFKEKPRGLKKPTDRAFHRRASSIRGKLKLLEVFQFLACLKIWRSLLQVQGVLKKQRFLKDKIMDDKMILPSIVLP